jgi:hypothetical protein
MVAVDYMLEHCGTMRVLLLFAAGATVELGAAWICAMSPELTAAYNAEFTRQFLARFGLPLFQGNNGLDQLEAGLITMSLAYAAGLWLLSRWSWDGNFTKLVVVGFSLVFQVTFLAMPGLYSTDIFSYVMYGRIAGTYLRNPYTNPPSAFINDPFLSWVFPFWRSTPSVYGPLWTDLTALVSSATGHASALDQVLVYKLLIWVSALVNLGLVWMLTARAAWLRGPRLAAFALYAWNPVVLFELAGNAHNDALMLTLLLVSVIPLTAERLGDRHWLAAVLSATASALIKFATAPVVVFYAAAGVRRWRTAVIAIATAIGLTTAVSWPYLGSADAIVTHTIVSNRALVLNSIPDLMAQFAVGLGAPIDDARSWSRIACALVYVGVLVWDLLRVWRLRTPGVALEASARALLLLPLLVLTWVWSWYFTWSIAMAAVLGIRTRLAQTIVAFSAIAPPVFYAHQYLNESMPTWPLLVYVGLPLLILLGCTLRAAREEVAG